MAYPNFTPEELATEEWRDVVDFENFYQVSSLGRVRSSHKKWNNWKERLLRPNISGSRGCYPKVTLVKNRKHFYRRVHQLVAAAFLGKATKRKPQVNHLDTDRSNNRITNLEYCNQQDNIDHAKAMGRLRKGTKHPRAKLTESQVLRIRQTDLSPKVLAREMEVSTGTIYAVRAHVVWTHI